MAENEPPAPGFVETLRRLCSRALRSLQNSVELFAVEVQEQKARLVKVLILTATAVLLANMALLVLTATIVVLAGPGARKPVLIALSLFYVLGAAGTFVLLRKELRSAPPPFEDTVSELKKDFEWLNPQK